MFTASGLLVRFLKVFEKSNYHSIKWVRYLTKANGGYQIRVCSIPRAVSIGANKLYSFDIYPSARQALLPMLATRLFYRRCTYIF